MKLQSNSVQSVGRLSAVSLLLTGLIGCGAVDDMVRIAGRNADEAGQGAKAAVRAVDNVPAPPLNPEAQMPKVIKVEQKTSTVVDAIVDQGFSVSVDCVSGVITPASAIAPAQQDNFVQSVCSQAAGKNQTSNSAQQSGVVRTVNAKDGYANLRSAPSTEVATLAQISNGTSVKLIRQTQNSSGQLWYKVEVNGQTGWMFSGLLD